VSPVKYEPGSYIPEDDILHSHRRELLISYREPNVRRRVRTDDFQSHPMLDVAFINIALKI
jgi:hypothetical protein